MRRVDGSTRFLRALSLLIAVVAIAAQADGETADMRRARLQFGYQQYCANIQRDGGPGAGVRHGRRQLIQYGHRLPGVAADAG